MPPMDRSGHLGTCTLGKHTAISDPIRTMIVANRWNARGGRAHTERHEGRVVIHYCFSICQALLPLSEGSGVGGKRTKATHASMKGLEGVDKPQIQAR